MAFLDADRKPCEKDQAVFAEGTEFDEHGSVVGRTYLTRPPGGHPPATEPDDEPDPQPAG